MEGMGWWNLNRLNLQEQSSSSLGFYHGFSLGYISISIVVKGSMGKRSPCSFHAPEPLTSFANPPEARKEDALVTMPLCVPLGTEMELFGKVTYVRQLWRFA